MKNNDKSCLLKIEYSMYLLGKKGITTATIIDKYHDYDSKPTKGIQASHTFVFSPGSFLQWSWSFPVKGQ